MTTLVLLGTALALLQNGLVVGAILFSLGLIGILSRRNLIVMFLSAELMLQGISVSLVAWSRYHGDFGGHVLVIFVLSVAACEAAMLLSLSYRHLLELAVLILQHGKPSEKPHLPVASTMKFHHSTHQCPVSHASPLQADHQKLMNKLGQREHV